MTEYLEYDQNGHLTYQNGQLAYDSKCEECRRQQDLQGKKKEDSHKYTTLYPDPRDATKPPKSDLRNEIRPW